MIKSKKLQWFLIMVASPLATFFIIWLARMHTHNFPFNSSEWFAASIEIGVAAIAMLSSNSRNGYDDVIIVSLVMAVLLVICFASMTNELTISEDKTVQYSFLTSQLTAVVVSILNAVLCWDRTIKLKFPDFGSPISKLIKCFTHKENV